MAFFLLYIALYSSEIYPNVKRKKRIRETKHLLTNADCSTDTTAGRTKNTQKRVFEKQKKSFKTAKLKNT